MSNEPEQIPHGWETTGAKEVSNLVITADNHVLEAPEPKREGKYYTLKQMQEIVGGYIEMITLADGRHMILDEEGKLKSKPVNLIATTLAESVLGGSDYICGDVLVCEDGRVD
tara:strand:+ start:369 stop:707 length:339 start_codon:yes stop_codon:yes gene_type:complete